MRRVALTGGIATGKSHVRQQFKKLGVPTIDADTLAREAVAPGTEGLAAVVQAFGPRILEPAGGLDRRKMAEVVFADEDARRRLEAIVHPVVRRATDEWFSSLEGGRHPFAIADIPLLYEVGRDRDFDTVIVVASDPAVQVRRVMERDGITDTQARQRVNAQLPIAEKVRRADYVIRTDGSYDETDRQVVQVHERLLSL